MLQYSVLSLNISHAPVEVLSRASVSEGSMKEAMAMLAQGIGKGVLLSTCTRTEVYTVDTDIDIVKGFLNRLSGMEMASYTVTLKREDAVYHLFRVASGLESVALGETQASGQVSRALVAAGEAGTLNHDLSRLFHGAIRTSRRVHSRTNLGRNPVSVASLGVNILAKNSKIDLRNSKVLLVGAGEMGRLAALNLIRRGIKDITVTSRRPHTAKTLADELSAKYIQFQERLNAIKECNILVTCTASPVPIISKADILSLRTGSSSHLYILDLSMPVDVEPSVITLPNVSLLTIQSLYDISKSKNGAIDTEILKAEEIVSFGFRKFCQSLSPQNGEPIIRDLTKHAEYIRQQELATTMAKLPNLTQAERIKLDAMTKSMFKKLLADPIIFLRSHNTEHISQNVIDIFGLNKV